MGVAPLSAWRASTARTLGRALWKPLIGSLLVVAVLLLNGMRHPGALLGFWLCAYVVLVTLYEFWRGAFARQAKGENFALALWRLVARNRRRYGGYVIHLGVVLIAIGIIGIEFFQQETQGQLAIGERLQVGGYAVEYKELAEFQTSDGRLVDRAVVNVYRDGVFVRELYPRQDFYMESRQPMTIPGLHSSWEVDVYVLLVSWEPISNANATFKLYVNPLVSWVWLGGMVFIFGTLVAAWPEREAELVRLPARARGLPAEARG
jgi:cytochrome c-type biogenesis protein CcmF